MIFSLTPETAEFALCLLNLDKNQRFSKHALAARIAGKPRFPLKTLLLLQLRPVIRDARRPVLKPGFRDLRNRGLWGVKEIYFRFMGVVSELQFRFMGVVPELRFRFMGVVSEINLPFRVRTARIACTFRRSGGTTDEERFFKET
ncbi:MAG: hypothetical protein IJ783_01070 [Kiritimatiellae bacterium]|nr:hypothetical protein [Kiritimatiellia bacterium]